jgi:Asp-tRNA(Asn)/Glu-tRNA(Gln) amidotransferase A subunit family amidase
LDSVLAAFWEYERALMANDLPALDRLFAPGPETLRGDASGILVGHDTISAFRQGRGGAPARDILHVEVRQITDDAALVIAITAPRTGGRGQQSQLWRRIDGARRVTEAHVSLPAPAIDPRVWRAIGSPLVAGSTDGPLVGETVAVKDLFAIEGQRIGAGNPTWLADAPVEATTAPAVQHLLDEGASVTGIAQTDEFAYSIAGQNAHYGTPPNPAVIGGLPGGSSSGPASAVALGQASIGLGTDTGGSIRVPASYQGLWGLRTTHGAVSVDGLLPLSPSFDTVGWLTRTSAALKGAAGASLRSHAAAGSYVVAPALLEHAQPDVRAAFLEAVGDDLETVDLGDIDELLAIFRTVQAAEAWESDGAWVAQHPDALGADVAGRFAAAALVTPEQEATARADLVHARARLEEVLGERVLLLPSASSAAPSALAEPSEIEATRQGTMRLTCIAGITGRPALSVPLLSVPQPGALLPAPVGLCLVGPQNSEIALIAMGELLHSQLVR